MINKILIVSQYFYPENFRVNDIALSLNKRGYDITVLTGLPNYPEGNIYQGYKGSHKKIDDYHGVKIHRLKIHPRKRDPLSLIINYLSFVWRGLRWVKKTNERFDLVFSFEVSPMTQVLPAIWMAKKNNVKAILYLQDVWPQAISMAGTKLPRVFKVIITQMVKYIYRQNPIILVPSKSYIPWVKEVNANLTVHYWPQYYESFYQPQKKKPKDLFDANKFTIMFTGNVGQSQGLIDLAEIIRELKHEINASKLQCVIIGDGRAKTQLIETVKSKKVLDYFIFLKAQPPEEIPNLLAHADIAYLSFSQNALFSAVIPAKLQSYMACGVPIFGVVEGESATIIQEAQGGIVVAPSSTQKTSELIKLINTPREQLAKWGENNRQYANKHFNKDILMDWLEENILSEDKNVQR